MDNRLAADGLYQVRPLHLCKSLIVRNHFEVLDFTFCFDTNKYNISQFLTASTKLQLLTHFFIFH